MMYSTISQVNSWGTAPTVWAAGQTSKLVSSSWDVIWDKVLGGTLFAALNSFGIFLAVGTLLFWLVDWARKMLEDESSRPFTEIIWPLIVIILLMNGGANIAALSRTIRTVTADVNTKVLDGVAGQLQLEEKLAAMADYSSLKGDMQALRGQCNAIVNEKELKSCIEVTGERATMRLAEYKKNHPDSGAFSRALEEIEKASTEDPMKGTGEIINQVGGVVAGATSRVRNAATNFIPNPLLLAIEVVLIALQAAFQHMIELAMLLTALLGPIAVGCSLLPMGGKPIFLWLTSFWSLGLCKICLNVTTGVFALLIHQSGTENTMVHALLIGLLAPILAMGMASGGGMAIFNGISQTASMAVGAVASAAGGAVGTAAGSKIASSVSSGIAAGE